MKKIFYLIISFLFLLPSLVFGDAAELEEVAQTISATLCPPFYADTNVVWSWDGKHPNGADYACDSAANAIQAASGTVEVGTFQGEAGSMNLDSASAGEYYRWSQTADQYICDNCDQTVCIKVYITAYDADEDFTIFESYESSVNFIQGILDSNDAGNDRAQITYRASDNSDTAFGSSLVTAQWSTIAMAWAGDDINSGCSATSNCDAEHSTNPGDQDPWENAWEPDLNELDHLMSGDLDDITIGNVGATAPDGSEAIYLTAVAIVNTYGASYDCTDLTGW